MMSAILVFGSLALIVVYLVSTRNHRVKTMSEKIRSSWGHPKKEFFHFERIERYAELMIKRDEFHRLSRQTMEDIDFYDLFRFVDRTSSSVGQQYLFHRLMHPSNDLESLGRLNAAANHFGKDAKDRERVQKELQRLAGADFVCSLLQERKSAHPTWLKYYPINIVLVVALFVLGFLYPILLVCLLVPLTLNTYLHFWNREKTYHFVRSFPQLSLLIDVCRNLLSEDAFRSSKPVEKSIKELTPLQWKLAMLGSPNDGSIRDELSQLAIYVVELMKGFFLIEIILSIRIMKELRTKRSAIAALFNYIGEIDTAISVASVRAGSMKTCTPEFINHNHNKMLTVSGLYHPLLDKCVKNDLNIRSKSILITGSNMSGKSTFLRTLIINSILAQTLFTCFAREFKSGFVRQFSSIRIDDSLDKGTSYFLEEVNLMQIFVREVESGMQNLFVLDEVFKGTNTVERIAAAKAILSYLNRGNNMVVVATHDLELSDMLESEYDLYHFADVFEDGDLSFDHTLRAGKMQSGNAIKILKISGYPESIVHEANELRLSLTAGLRPVRPL